MIFLDTNILIYAASLHGEVDPRTEKARNLLDRGGPYGLSVQVLNEFFDRATRKSRVRFLTDEEAIYLLSKWREFAILPNTLDLFDAAIAIRTRFGYRYYDCAIIAAALSLRCDTLYSEDMQHGQVIDVLTIINPFL